MTSFTASACPGLYWNEAGVGYLLAPGDEAGATLSFAESWSGHTGCYLLVGEAVPPDAAAQQRFAGAVRVFLAAPGLDGARFAWFATPNAPSGRLSGPTLICAGPPDAKGVAVLRALARFPFGGTSLLAGPGCALQPNAGQDGFILTASGPRAIYFTAQDGVELDVVQGPTGFSLAGATPGAFSLTLKLGETQGVDDLTHLDAGPRIFYPDPQTIAAPDAPVFLQSCRYPLFTDNNLVFQASLDPNAPLNPSRTQLAFAAGAPIASAYVTNLGYGFTLTPQAGACLVFAPRPADSSAPGDALYLVPSGGFLLNRPGETLMCGVSGVEYLKLPDAGPSMLSFTPGGAAFAGGQAGAPLSLVASTAWAYVSCPAGGGVPIPYCAQPDSGVLYTPPSTPPPGAPSLSYLEVVSAVLPPIAVQNFPLFPYNAVPASGAAQYRKLESTAIAPARRAAIARQALPHPRNAALADAPDIAGTTPQGLLASFMADFSAINLLTLGQSEDASTLAMHDVKAGSALWTALQSNQLCLVITDPAAIAANINAAQAVLRADEWSFFIDPTPGSGWRPMSGSQPTFLIFKFAARALADLAAQPGAWAEAATFNAGDAANAAAQLTAYVQATQLQAQTDDNLAWFVNNVLLDPNWNGIVALNCHTPVSGWPEQLQGLAAGIDPRKLFAHHVGIRISPVKTGTGNGLVMQPSSIFGLINYQDPAHIPPSATPYDFKVLSLEVLFSNSHVTTFASTIALQTNQFFGAAASLDQTPDNNLLFNGTYQDSNGEGSYKFLLSQDSPLRIASPVLARIDVAQAEFVTAAKPEADGTIETRFLMSGMMSFNALAGFDAFSFDSLVFSNLAIDMAVTPSGDPDLPAQKLMSFDATHISFGLDQGTVARPDSLYSAFPLKLTGFVQAGANTSPADLGYAPVTTPITAGQLGAPWFGLVLQLELGSQGAWAGGGSFTAGLLIAWGLSENTDPNIFTGLQLPGTSGGQLQITLEGPLKLSLKNISFQVDPGGAYLLWLQGLAMGAFGLTFPPAGRTDILLFAKGGAKKTLGWYAVYDKGSSAQQSGGGQPSSTKAVR